MKAFLPSFQSWWLLSLATSISLAIVSASHLFTDRVAQLLEQQATELLASDMLIRSNQPIAAKYIEIAREHGLQSARVVQLRTAIFIDNEPQLIELKAVSDSYPLRGKLEKKQALLETAEASHRGPLPGELWVDNRLVGQLDHNIDLGYAAHPVTSILHYEPDRGGSLFNLAPRVMMHIDDLQATGLLLPGSRASYRFLVAGSSEQVERFEATIKPQLADGESLQNIRNARPEMRKALDRTSRFFALAIVMTLVIAMVAIAITARYMTSRESTRVAVMRTFGISSRRLLRFYLGQLFRVWCWSLPLGLLLGYLAQFPLQWILAFLFDTRLPDASGWPYVLAALVGLISLYGFSLPPILNLIETPPVQVLRPMEQQHSRRRSLLLAGVSLLTLLVVLLMIVPDVKLAVQLFGVVLLTAVIVPLLLRSLLMGLRRFGRERFWYRNYVLSRLLVPGRNALFVMSGFSIALFSVLLIYIIKSQLLIDWERQLPEDQPNFFFINIPTSEVEPLHTLLQGQDILTSTPYPLIRSRLQTINDVDVNDLQFERERGSWLIKHTFNISYTSELPEGNEILSGAWPGSDKQPGQFSVEQGMAEDLQLKVGDRLSFDVGGDSFSGRISSLRSVEWENFRPNFYVIGSAEQLADKPQTWLMSAYVSDENRGLLKTVFERFPTVTLLDVSEIMQRIKGIIERASLALEFFFIFAVIAAMIVLLSALNAANRDRQMEVALLQALGAKRSSIRWSQLLEFALMGLMVGLFAAAFSSFTAYLIAGQFFDTVYHFRLETWFFSVLLAIGLISLVGVLFLKQSFSISPMRLLRG